MPFVHFLQKQHQIVFRKLYVGNGDEDWVADRIMTPELKWWKGKWRIMPLNSSNEEVSEE